MLSALFHWIALSIIGVPYALALALWVGLVSQFIPVVGTYLAGALAVLIALLHDPVDGVAVLPTGTSDPARYRGVRIENARNYDWEDISSDPEGRLYIGDIGNNDSARRNLAIYVVDEPDPVQAWRRHAAKLEDRAAALTERRFDAIRFRGPGTDLTVGLTAANKYRVRTSWRW